MTHQIRSFMLIGLFLFILFIPQTSQAASIPKADLFFVTIDVNSRSTNGDESERNIWAEVGNKGLATVMGFKIKVEWLNKKGKVLDSCIEDFYNINLVPVYGSEKLFFGACGSTPDKRDEVRATLRDQSYKVRVTLDPNNEITETNKRNNVVAKDLALPNPIVAGLRNSFFNGTETTPSITFDLVNLGKGSLGSIPLELEWLDKKNKTTVGCTILSYYQKVNSSQAYVELCTDSLDKRYYLADKVRVTIDPDNKVAQMNEKNNVYTKLSALPDLSAGITFNSRTKNPVVIITNTGKAEVPSNFWVVYDWFGLNGEKLGGCIMEVNKEMPGRIYAEADPFCGNEDTYSQAAKFRVTLNVGSGLVASPDFAESNENNNVIEKIVPGRFRITGKLKIPKLSDLAGYGRRALGLNENAILDPLPIPENSTFNPPETSPTPVASSSPVVNTPVVVPIPATTVAPTPVVTEPEPMIVTPTPVADTGDRKPSFTVELTNDGLATYTVNAHLDYYGTYKDCTGPRYFDPIIVAWGQVDTLPVLDGNNNFTTTHKYNVKNSYYDIVVSVINSCFQRATKNYRVYPKL